MFSNFVSDEQICTSDRSQFLRLFAEFKYIIYNATRDMHDEMTISSSDVLVSHPDFDALRRKLEKRSNSKNLDGFGRFLYGLVLSANKQKAEARKQFVEAIKRQPYLWAAWKALLKVVPPSHDQLLNELPQNSPLLPLFQVEWNISTGEANDETMNALNELLEIFPNSTWVHAQLGEVYAIAR